MNPRYPIFVPSKGRYQKLYTISVLERCNIPYTVVVEKQEYPFYAAKIDRSKILVLPHRDQGLTVTRNWIWDYAQYELQTPYFWTFDDNIRDFYRLHKNIKYRIDSGAFLQALEDWAERYENLYICGMQYEMFVPRKQKCPPIVFNTRVYSNMLIKTDIPYRNVTFYNDDTDLCLRILKDGFCTALFNIFLIDKIWTMKVKGGMTDYYKQTNKRLEFAQELFRAHPDIVRVVWKYNRWHHEIDYSIFKSNKLIKKPGLEIPNEPNEYGMVFITPDNDN